MTLSKKHLSARLFISGLTLLSLWLALISLPTRVQVRPGNKNPAPVSTTATTLPPLQGDEAIKKLRQSGEYDSLEQAVTATRYKVRADSDEPHIFRATNAANKVAAIFTGDGARLQIEQDGRLLETAWRLKSYGYGEEQRQLMSGEIKAQDNRVEIQRSATVDRRPEIIEWFENKPEGLEQGFLINASPTVGNTSGIPDSKLRLVLEVSGAVRARATADRQMIELVRGDGSAALLYEKLKVWDATGKELTARMRAQQGEVWLEVKDEAALYPITIDPTFKQLSKFTISEGSANDQFGTSVALAGYFAIVGAPLDDVSNTDQGSAYVYARAGAVWVQMQQLIANDGAAGDLFGSSVSISGNTAIIGAPGDDVGVNANQGSAYVFTYDSANRAWSQQTKLTASDGAADDKFGAKLGMINFTAIVGAPGDDLGSNVNQGSAYIFTENGTVWPQEQKLTADDGARGDAFGSSVSIGLNLDIGIRSYTAVVGAPGDDSGANLDQGSAYIFKNSSTGWTQQQKVKAGDGAAGDYFGLSVSISGNTTVIGAPGDDVGDKADQGSAYVFKRDTRGWLQQRQLTDNDGAKGDLFGNSVSLSGDTAIVSADSDDVTKGNQGSACVFTRDGRTWAQQTKVIANGGAPDDQFGVSVSLSGESAIIGAAFADAGANANQGSAYVFKHAGTDWTQQQQLTSNDGQADEEFGYSVSISGDTAVVGADNDDVGTNVNQGSAYVFTRSGTVWSLQQTLLANDGAAKDRFGTSVSLSGETIAVGSLKRSVYIFTRSGGIWTQQAKLTANDGMGASLGWSVMLEGNTLLAGAYGDDIGSNEDQGAAYVFTRNGSTWTQQARLTASDGSARDWFGFSVALAGDTAIIGAPLDNVDTNNYQGSAYIFTRSGTNWTQRARLNANENIVSQGFGWSVAISGNTTVVGAPGVSDDFYDTGMAYVFTGSGSTWTRQARLTASDSVNFENSFGRSVAIRGDTAIIGARRAMTGTNYSPGAAYLFTRRGAVWTQRQKLTANDGASDDEFGHSVAYDGGTAIIGAIKDVIDAPVAKGSAYIFQSATRFDFDGDRKADISVFRPSNATWYRINSSNGGSVNFQLGQAGDRIAPADFDGDGMTDLAVFRPSNANWYFRNSANASSPFHFGTNEDTPVPADYDGDGRDDIAVFRPSDGYWYMQRSTADFLAWHWGQGGDVPQTGDYDGDGKADLVVWRPSNATWYLALSTTNYDTSTAQITFQVGDKPDAADFDGDGLTDVAVFRPSTGDWHIRQSSDGVIITTHFGANGDIPVAADYDGDGKADRAVFRPSNNKWYWRPSIPGLDVTVSIGNNGDIPAEASSAS